MTTPNSNRLPILAAEIRAAHEGVEAAAKTRADRALDAGRALLEAKSLVRHGGWLPWLKEHCGLPERTAQLYMKLAELDLPAEMIAVLGMQRAVRSQIVGTLPDWLTFYNEPTQREWLLFAWFLGDGERNYPHVEWLMRNSWPSPDDWLAADEWRKTHGLAEFPEACRQAWAVFKAQHADRSRGEIEMALSKPQSATVADLPGRSPAGLRR